MSKKATNLVGRKVRIDYPIRWITCKPEYVEQMRTDTAKSEPLFGKTGEIVAHDPSAKDGNTLTVLLDDTKRLVYLFDGAVTVTSEAPNPESEIISLLTQILAALKKT